MYHAHVLEGKGRTPFPPTRHIHIKTQGHTQIRQTLSLREKMDLSAEEAMLRERKRERQGETESV